MSDVDFGDTAAGLHDRVVHLLSKEKRGLLLDAPSGTGEMSHLLQQTGFSVIAGDIDPEVCKAKNVAFQELDLNSKLPFPDGHLDYVINVEGLEHLENPHHTIREFARILRSGGKVIFTTPNVLNIFSRLRYLLIGFHQHFGDYYANEDNFYVLHINPVGFPEINFALKKNGLVVEEITANRSVVAARGWFSKIILSMLKVITKMVTKMKVQDPYLKKVMLEKGLLEGEIIIIKCRKE